jgi:hypothetical protein
LRQTHSKDPDELHRNSILFGSRENLGSTPAMSQPSRISHLATHRRVKPL